MTHEDQANVDALQDLPAWTLAQALRKKVSTAPTPGTRGQLLTLIDTLIHLGGAWLVQEGKTHV